MVGVGLVALVENHTREEIIENERQLVLRNLHALLPPETFNNNIVSDQVQVPADPLLGTTQASAVYRARLNNKPVAAVLTSIAPDGYSGRIHLLIGIYTDGRIAGVRVVKHAETPGLGDAIEHRKSDWIAGFDNKSLSNPDRPGWRVQRDGGEFDQFTGATITPRAVVAAARRALLYYAKNADMIFDQKQP